MIRVVLDTNIVVSSLLNPQGSPAQVFLLAILDPNIQLCLSGDIFAEYEEVIRRPRLGRTEKEVQDALHAIRERGFWVRPIETIHACSDPDDNIFLECAQASEAHYLVTGNVKHFPAVWGPTQILTSRRFLDAVM